MQPWGIPSVSKSKNLGLAEVFLLPYNTFKIHPFAVHL